MSKSRKPAVDPALEPRSGVSRDGQPLSYNRLPAADLDPWIGWLYASSVRMPEDYCLNCSLLSDTALIRIQLEGEWTAETADGTMTHGPGALYFGPQSRAMPVSVRGSFTSVGLSLKPGTGYTVTGLPASDYLDRIVPCSEVGLPVEGLLNLLPATASAHELLEVLEGAVRQFIGQVQPRHPPEISARFERMALADPSFSVAAFAEAHDISMRQLERTCQRDFGMTPKQVLRRSRALDMASHLRGVADSSEEEEAMLRYYDQSHMAREFHDLFGMTPRQFTEMPQPLMTLALESRQSRRLAMLDRLRPGGVRPWLVDD